MQFSPSVYEHAANLINKTPWDVSRDKNLLFQAHAKAYNLYKHSPIIVGIDIYNLEPEAYGAVIDKPDETGIPAISQHFISSMQEIKELRLFNPEKDGRISMIIETGKRLAKEFPEADVKIPVSGPFSITSNLAGFETLLMDTFTAPETVFEALEHIVRGQMKFCQAIIDSGLGIAFFESSATPPLISPDMFNDVVLPALKSILTNCESMAGRPVPCIIGGDTTPILEMLMETNTKYVICPSETDQQKFMEKMVNYPEVMVRINMDPGVISSGDMKAIHKEINRCYSLASNRENVCLGTGVLPFETDYKVVLDMQKYIDSIS